jgi:predicted nucleic acid-binding protein
MTMLIDTNILIYHTTGSQVATSFLAHLLTQQALHISILTKIEFLGWDKHTPEGFENAGV